jgi:hypothetical protein
VRTLQFILLIIAFVFSLALLFLGTMFLQATLNTSGDLSKHGTVFAVFNPAHVFGEEASALVFALFSACFFVPGVLLLCSLLWYLKKRFRSSASNSVCKEW